MTLAEMREELKTIEARMSNGYDLIRAMENEKEVIPEDYYETFFGLERRYKLLTDILLSNP